MSRARKSAEAVKRAFDFIERLCAELRKIDADERFHYPTATVQVNAPLALVQVQMEAQCSLCLRILGDCGYCGPEMKIKPRRPR